MAEVARDYDVSSQWIYMLLARYDTARYDTEGEAGRQPRSRHPHGNARATPPKVEQRIVELRKQLVDDGLDAGAHTIAWHLSHELDRAPAPATIWRILLCRGFVTLAPTKRPKSSSVRFQTLLRRRRPGESDPDQTASRTRPGVFLSVPARVDLTGGPLPNLFEAHPNPRRPPQP